MANILKAGQKISKDIFTTSDKGACCLYNWFKDDEILKEYIYLKAFVFVRAIEDMRRADEQAKVENEGLERLLAVVLNTLDKSFKKDIFGYGCSMDEMFERLDYYEERVGYHNDDQICITFLDIIGVSRAAYNEAYIAEINGVVKYAAGFVRKSIVDACLQPNPKTGGCLTTIACLVLVLVVVLI